MSFFKRLFSGSGRDRDGQGRVPGSARESAEALERRLAPALGAAAGKARPGLLRSATLPPYRTGQREPPPPQQRTLRHSRTSV